MKANAFAHRLNRTVSAEESALIARAARLRRRLYGFQNLGELPTWFSRELAASWREHGVTGVRMACWSLSAELTQVAGGYDLYSEARAIAAGNILAS